MKPTNWLSVLGRFDVGQQIIFRGGELRSSPEEREPSGGPEIGNLLSNLEFAEGDIKVTIRFLREVRAVAGVILDYLPQTGGFVFVQIGASGSLCCLRTFRGDRSTMASPTVPGMTTLAERGPSDQLLPDVDYALHVNVMGSRVRIRLNGVDILDERLPGPLPRGGAGLWAGGRSDIAFAEFDVEARRPVLFVVMQFSDPFNELYRDVIKPVANAAGFDVIRADEQYGPGIIIAEIERTILESHVIVADVTPQNANVFWEVGYAHALRKPTILLAERATRLPFDVAPFRVLFYDNTIAGKARVEEGLQKHLAEISRE